MDIYSYENLKKLSKTKTSKQYFNEIKTYYDATFKDKAIYNLSFSDYKLFFSEGDRRTYETAFFARRERLSLLQVLALFDDSYIEELEEIMAAICDEFTWIIPAHVVSYQIDLFCRRSGSGVHSCGLRYGLVARLGFNKRTFNRRRLFAP